MLSDAEGVHGRDGQENPGRRPLTVKLKGLYDARSCAPHPAVAAPRSQGKGRCADVLEGSLGRPGTGNASAGAARTVG